MCVWTLLCEWCNTIFHAFCFFFVGLLPLNYNSLLGSNLTNATNCIFFFFIIFYYIRHAINVLKWNQCSAWMWFVAQFWRCCCCSCTLVPFTLFMLRDHFVVVFVVLLYYLLDKNATKYKNQHTFQLETHWIVRLCLNFHMKCVGVHFFLKIASSIQSNGAMLHQLDGRVGNNKWKRPFVLLWDISSLLLRLYGCVEFQYKHCYFFFIWVAFPLLLSSPSHFIS